MTGFVVLGTEGPILSIGHDRHLLGADPHVDHEALGGLRTFFPEHEIVIMRAAFITMSGNLEERLTSGLDPIDSLRYE